MDVCCPPRPAAYCLIKQVCLKELEIRNHGSKKVSKVHFQGFEKYYWKLQLTFKTQLRVFCTQDLQNQPRRYIQKANLKRVLRKGKYDDLSGIEEPSEVVHIWVLALGWRRQRDQQPKVILSCAVNLNNMCSMKSHLRDRDGDRGTHRKNGSCLSTKNFRRTEWTVMEVVF